VKQSDGSQVITGVSQGIGAGLVAGYRRRGWGVVANALTIKPSADPDVLTVERDISERATTQRIIGEALRRFARIDTLVNNAGVFVSIVDGILFLEASPYVTGVILHIDGGQIAGH
jgi:NAD(P)-dependent dehydrogenase (short-subunit alcohol dehydrogenase family)